MSSTATVWADALNLGSCDLSGCPASLRELEVCELGACFGTAGDSWRWPAGLQRCTLVAAHEAGGLILQPDSATPFWRTLRSLEINTRNAAVRLADDTPLEGCKALTSIRLSSDGCRIIVNGVATARLAALRVAGAQVTPTADTSLFEPTWAIEMLELTLFRRAPALRRLSLQARVLRFQVEAPHDDDSAGWQGDPCMPEGHTAGTTSGLAWELTNPAPGAAAGTFLLVVERGEAA